MAFTRVQGGAADGALAVTISAVGSGNAICGVVSWDDSTVRTVSSVTDDKGNSYNVETKIKDTTNNQAAAAFSRTNITNAPVTITVTLSGAANFPKIVVDEFSGGSTASTDERDGTAHGGQFQATPGTGANAITSGTFTTTTNGDLIWGGCFAAATTTLASNGTSFSTGTQNGTTYAGQTEYREQTTAASGTAATFTQAAGTQRMTYMIALKPAAGAASFTPYNPWPQRGPILAQKRRSFSGWDVHRTHRWRSQRGLLVPSREIIKRAA